MIETPSVTVKVSKELLAELANWSDPVQIKIEQLSNGEYDMIARRHDCPDQPRLDDHTPACEDRRK